MRIADSYWRKAVATLSVATVFMLLYEIETRDSVSEASMATVSEMTAANEGIGYLLVSAGSSMQMGLAFAGLIVVGAMAMVMYELFSYIEKHTTAWAHRGSHGG